MPVNIPLEPLLYRIRRQSTTRNFHLWRYVLLVGGTVKKARPGKGAPVDSRTLMKRVAFPQPNPPLAPAAGWEETWPRLLSPPALGHDKDGPFARSAYNGLLHDRDRCFSTGQPPGPAAILKAPLYAVRRLHCAALPLRRQPSPGRLGIARSPFHIPRYIGGYQQTLFHPGQVLGNPQKDAHKAPHNAAEHRVIVGFPPVPALPQGGAAAIKKICKGGLLLRTQQGQRKQQYTNK